MNEILEETYITFFEALKLFVLKKFGSRRSCYRNMRISKRKGKVNEKKKSMSKVILKWLLWLHIIGDIKYLNLPQLNFEKNIFFNALTEYLRGFLFCMTKPVNWTFIIIFSANTIRVFIPMFLMANVFFTFDLFIFLSSQRAPWKTSVIESNIVGEKDRIRAFVYRKNKNV